MIDRGFNPADPELLRKGFGGLHPKGRAIDPFFDFDLPITIRAMTQELLEHRATRPYLEQYGPAYRSHPRGVLLSCTRCEESPCSCGDIGNRSRHYMVLICRDPVLGLIFEKYGLTVRGA